jgi:hypothetical protein
MTTAILWQQCYNQRETDCIVSQSKRKLFDRSFPTSLAKQTIYDTTHSVLYIDIQHVKLEVEHVNMHGIVTS